VDGGYEAYCLVDPLSYDSPVVTRGDDLDFSLAHSPPVAGWEHPELDYRPTDCGEPAHGSKVAGRIEIALRCMELNNSEPTVACTEARSLSEP
jgi:hypothetical protein